MPAAAETPAERPQSRVYTVDDLRIVDPWSDYRIGGGNSTRLFFELHNTGDESDRLIGVRSPIANGPSAFRLVRATNGQRTLEMLPAIPVPAESGRLELSEAGYFIELNDLNMPLTMGTTFPVVLEFERAGPIEVMVTNHFHAPNVGRHILERAKESLQ